MNKYCLNILAIGIALCFTAFESIPEKIRSDVKLKFSGNALTQAQVADERHWREDNSPVVCNGSNRACAIIVDHSFLNGPIGSRTLNTNAITLGATPGASGAAYGYVPEQNGGTGFISEIINHD